MTSILSLLRRPRTTDSGRGNAVKPRRSRLDARILLICGACCPFLLLAIGVSSYADFQVDGSGGGPAYVAQVFSPCQGYANLYPTTDGRYTGSQPDFTAASLAPIVVNGVDTWELKVLGLVGSSCRPTKTFRLATPSTNPEGDYCLLSGCANGTAAVFVP